MALEYPTESLETRSQNYEGKKSFNLELYIQSTDPKLEWNKNNFC